MEALTISPANLNAIEQNLGKVANELNGVVNNVSDVNQHVNEVENKVNDLNSEIKGLIKDIKETTILTNARQAIMYNNEQIDKKYGYYDNVRRNTLSILDACLNSNIRITSLIKLRDNILLNNPNYWLANALCALTSWLLDDKENANKEMTNALKKDPEKTSLFFSLVNLKLGRTQTSINWLNKYLSYETPLKLDKDFITILDLVSSGLFGDEAKNILLNKIDGWFRILNNETAIKDKQVNTWYDYFQSDKKIDIILPIYRSYGTEAGILEENLAIGEAIGRFNGYLDDVMNLDSSNKTIDDVLHDLVYEYEEKEQVFQKDNLLNNLIIQCNGDRDEAMRLYKKQEDVFDDKTDLLSLFTAMVLYKDNFRVSNDTRRIALSFVKQYILEGLNKFKDTIIDHDYKIQVGDFTTFSKDGKNIEKIREDANNFIASKFDVDDKDLILTLIIIDIVGIIGLFITRNGGILNILLIIALVLSNLFLFIKLNKRSKIRDIAKQNMKNNLFNSLDQILAEMVDYSDVMKDDMEIYDVIVNKLNNMVTTNYMASNGERNIDVGE